MLPCIANYLVHNGRGHRRLKEEGTATKSRRAVAESTLPAVGNRRLSIPLRQRSGTGYTTLNLATVSRSVGNLATRSD